MKIYTILKDHHNRFLEHAERLIGQSFKNKEFSHERLSVVAMIALVLMKTVIVKIPKELL